MDIATLYQIYLKHPVVITDSRHCTAGSIFFALKGETFDGNAFAAQALEDGCAYAVVDEKEFARPDDDRFILVEDCLKMLQKLANYHRQQLGTEIISITGTNGKTTTKELIASVLSTGMRVLYTEGNLNNHIGVPLTLLRLTEGHQVAVIEMGANHPGEIRMLSEIVEPDYGLITNVGKAHLEGFGSFENILHTKTELYDYLRPNEDAVVFVRYENRYLNGRLDGLYAITYGEYEEAKIVGQVVSCQPFLEFRWKFRNGKQHYSVRTQLIGEYNLENALAAVAVGYFFNIAPEEICRALEAYRPQNNRSQLQDTGSNRLIIDAYNANPTSMMASLKNFAQMNLPHQVVILGDMKELGEGSTQEHQKIVDFLKECPFERVILAGKQFAAISHPFESYPDVQAVIKALQADKPEGKNILIKGSNSTRLIQVVEYL